MSHNQLDVFGTGVGNSMYHKSFDRALATFSDWMEFLWRSTQKCSYRSEREAQKSSSTNQQYLCLRPTMLLYSSLIFSRGSLFEYIASVFPPPMAGGVTRMILLTGDPSIVIISIERSMQIFQHVPHDHMNRPLVMSRIRNRMCVVN
jgi:hypothetical protein